MEHHGQGVEGDTAVALREDLQQVGQPLTRAERRRQLSAAAEALLPNYVAGGELTIFTALDSMA